jgi:hypothetical protein
VKGLPIMRKAKPRQPGINQVNGEHLQGAGFNLNQVLHCNYWDLLSPTGPVEDFGVIADAEVIAFFSSIFR